MSFTIDFDNTIETEEYFYEITASVTGILVEYEYDHDGYRVEIDEYEIRSIKRVDHNDVETNVVYDDLPADVMVKLDDAMLEALIEHHNEQEEEYDDFPSDEDDFDRDEY